MRVLVCGATGCVGGAVLNALRSRGHQVIEGARSAHDGRGAMHVDFMQPVAPADWAQRLSAARVDAVVNCVGILMASRQQRFERVHAAGPIELFRGAALARVRRVVQVSALGVARDAAALAMPYLRSKLEADDALAALPIDGAVLRPSLVYGPRSQSGALFALLASLPVISLPGRGEQRVQPLHVFELAEAIARLLEQAAPARGVYELGGAEVLSYRDMLARYRDALRLGRALWLPLPMPLMRLSARAAKALPQKVLSGDTIRLLERGSVAAPNAALALLGREPTAMARGLAVTPPVPLFDLSVRLSPKVSLMLRASLATAALVGAGGTGSARREHAPAGSTAPLRRRLSQDRDHKHRRRLNSGHGCGALYQAMHQPAPSPAHQPLIKPSGRMPACTCALASQASTRTLRPAKTP